VDHWKKTFDVHNSLKLKESHFIGSIFLFFCLGAMTTLPNIPTGRPFCRISVTQQVKISKISNLYYFCLFSGVHVESVTAGKYIAQCKSETCKLNGKLTARRCILKWGTGVPHSDHSFLIDP
jgi:hypothetical protein